MDEHNYELYKQLTRGGYNGTPDSPCHHIRCETVNFNNRTEAINCSKI